MSKRVRTHANPLRRFPLPDPPEWKDPTLPFALEFGSSGGKFLIEHAALWPEMNILGAEIREPLVLHLSEKIKDLQNAYVLWGNIAGQIRDYVPSGVIQKVYIFFPDPWPKKKHHKRRVINSNLLDELAPLMPENSEIHVMTDHEDLFADIVSVFMGRSDFHSVSPVDLPVRSDWEDHCILTARPYQKLLYVRT